MPKGVMGMLVSIKWSTINVFTLLLIQLIATFTVHLKSDGEIALQNKRSSDRWVALKEGGIKSVSL